MNANRARLLFVQTYKYVFALATVCNVSSMANAQIARERDTSERLAKLVTIDKGYTTLGEIARSLSDQTGLDVFAEPYLTDRRVLLELPPMAGRDILSDLVDLDGLDWRETEKGRIKISRLSGPAPQTLAEVPVALRSAMPRDFARFLGIGASIDEVAAPGDNYPAWLAESDRKGDPTHTTELQRRIRDKIAALVHNGSSSLYTVETARPLAGKGIPYNQLSRDQRKSLFNVLFFQVWTSVTGFAGHSLLYDRLTGVERDARTAYMTLHNGNGLMVNGEMMFGAGRAQIGFGVSIPVLAEQAPPLPMPRFGGPAVAPTN